MNKRILIVGLGLIGGSLALAIRKEHKHAVIAGYDIDHHTVKMAKALQIIDEEASTLETASRFDFILLAAPVEQTEKMLEMLENVPLKKGIIISDVGSTKERIVQKAKSLTERGIAFIGGHPMAGSHKSGILAAKAHLFENAYYILTPSADAENVQIEELKHLLKGTKANFVIMSPEMHDQAAGVISHFPHIVAASLVRQAKNHNEGNAMIRNLAAGGFRDITRIASSSPPMWRDILIHNRKNLIKLIDDWAMEMAAVRSMLENEDKEAIFSFFEGAKNFRDELPLKAKGAIPSFYDLYVDVPDYPGVISEITGYLAREEISITNIRILETREEIYGVLRLSFQTEEDREKAKLCIEGHTEYETFFSK